MSELVLINVIVTIVAGLLIVLTERKFLAWLQRRLGPSMVGRNGSHQIVGDLFKLIFKVTYLIPHTVSSIVPLAVFNFFNAQLLLSLNFVLSPELHISLSVDSMILYHLIITLFSNISFIWVGSLTLSRYALIAVVRSVVHIISLDIYITIIFTILILHSQSSHFHDFIIAQSLSWNLLLFFPLMSTFVILLLLEAKRTPFDHAETESEVVAGYAVEFSGILLLIFYLCEYLHLMISSIQFVIFFLGGWYIPSFTGILPSVFMPSKNFYL
jgi:NADH-quinone oxidoreductase subunit H